MERVSRITVDDVAEAVRKVRCMSLKDKEALTEEIYRRQPHMLASCLVQPKLGVELAAVDFLLNILLVCYQAMKESGLQWSLITEDEQERQMQRWIGAVDFSERGLENIAAASAREQYAREHPEQPLLAFVIGETTQWLDELAQRRAEAESDKFVMMASMNMVNCIAGASTSSVAHG
jgi:hypothetical protein